MNRVVAIDDEPINLKIYERLVRQLDDTTITSFTVSHDALKWLGMHDADLVLVDYLMPEPDGLAVIESIRHSIRSEIPIIMVTGSAEFSIRRRALELGANEFLEKPIDPSEFSVRIRNLLKLRDRERKLRDRALLLADEVRRATAQIEARERETIHRLTRAAEFRDDETGNHILRMGQYAGVIAGELGFARDDVELMVLAAPMHDIGKVAIPDGILLKPGKLTPDEWATMRQHAVIGYEILSGSESALLRKAAEIARSHHEKFDGTGYPDSLAGDAIPLAGRIVAVGDVFDALVSRRPYKEPWPVEEALDEIVRKSGSHFDPHVVSAFSRASDEITAIYRRFADEVLV